MVIIIYTKKEFNIHAQYGAKIFINNCHLVDMQYNNLVGIVWCLAHTNTKMIVMT